MEDTEDPAFKKFKGGMTYPVTEDVNSKIALFEICGYDPSRRHMQGMAEAFKKIGGAMEKRQKAA